MQTRKVRSHLNSLITDRVAYIDRVTLWLDTNRPVISPRTKTAIQAEEKNLEELITPMSKFQPRWKQKLQLHQPTHDLLRHVHDDINQATCNYLINRVELAVDWITKNRTVADELHLFFQTNFLHGHGKEYFYENDHQSFRRLGTSYFAPKKTAHMIPVIYSDKKSKIADQHCTHFEYRVVSSQECERKGIDTFVDLIEFDIVGFFKSQVRFCQKPAKWMIGKAISDAEGRALLTKRGYEKTCDSFLREQNLAYESVQLQRLLHLLPELTDELSKSVGFHREVIKALLS